MVLLSYFYGREREIWMALQVWLPLNGSIYNQGLNDVSILSRSVTYGTGKIASQGAKFNGDCNQYIHIGNTEDFQYDEFTWSVWIYPTSFSVKGFIISHGRDYNKYGVNILVDTNGALCIFSEKAWSGITTLILNTWYHIVVSLKENTIKCYLNGNLVKTFTSDAQIDYGESNGLTIGKMSCAYSSTTSYFPFNGIIQDVRIYDEALSPKQVKLLSQGLVCHYPMGNVDGKIGGRNLLVKTNQGKTKWANAHADGSYSCESVNWNGINAVKMSCATPTTSWKMFTFDGLLENFDKLEPSAIYTLSYDVVGNVNVGFSNLWDSDATHSIMALAQEIVIKKTYGFHYIVNITLKDALNKSKQVVYFTNRLKAGESVIIANLKLEKGNKATAYTPCPTDDPVMYDNVIYDTSGYCNNGSVTDSTCPTWSSDTPRYKGSYVFNGNNQYLKFQNPITSSSTDFTISCWVKFDDTTGNSTICTMRTAVGNGIALFKIGNKIRFDDNAQFTFSDYTISANAWTHVVVTRSSSCKNLYVNGILKQTVNTVGDMKLISNVGTIGASSQSGDGISNYLNGQLSDFRIYATALDNQTIEELYKVGASVDSSGNLMLAGEVMEE